MLANDTWINRKLNVCCWQRSRVLLGNDTGVVFTHIWEHEIQLPLSSVFEVVVVDFDAENYAAATRGNEVRQE